MSTNCIHCGSAKRTGTDLLCNDCRRNSEPEHLLKLRALPNAVLAKELRGYVDRTPVQFWSCGLAFAIEEAARRLDAHDHLADETERKPCPMCDCPLEVAVVDGVRQWVRSPDPEVERLAVAAEDAVMHSAKHHGWEHPGVLSLLIEVVDAALAPFLCPTCRRVRSKCECGAGKDTGQ